MTSKFVGLGGGNIMPGSPCDSGYTGARGSTWLGNSLNPPSAGDTPAGRTRAGGVIGESVRRAFVPYGGAGPVGVVGVQTKRRGDRLGVLKIGRV